MTPLPYPALSLPVLSCACQTCRRICEAGDLPAGAEDEDEEDSLDHLLSDVRPATLCPVLSILALPSAVGAVFP